MGAEQTFIAYKILEDHEGKLLAAAPWACNFWNHFIRPEHPMMIHMALSRWPFRGIARAPQPVLHEGAMHGRLEFNKRYLDARGAKKLAAFDLQPASRWERLQRRWNLFNW